jgi:hypothetical protein
MLRKTLGTVTAISALCVGSAAMAAHMGGGGGGWGGGGGMMHGGRAPMTMNGGGSMGPTMRGGPMTATPMTDAKSDNHGASHARRRPGVERAHCVGRPLP